MKQHLTQSQPTDQQRGQTSDGAAMVPGTQVDRVNRRRRFLCTCCLTQATLVQQHELADREWEKVERESERLFSVDKKNDANDWQRFYLTFNQFVVSYLNHLQYEELVALPALWEAASDEELMKGLQEMFKHFTPEIVARSKKWLSLACSLSELKSMGYAK